MFKGLTIPTLLTISQNNTLLLFSDIVEVILSVLVVLEIKKNCDRLFVLNTSSKGRLCLDTI